MGLFNRLFRRGAPIASPPSMSEAEGSVEERRASAWNLGTTGDPNVLPLLLKYAADESVEVRRAAVSSIEQLWWTGDLMVIEKLIPMLNDQDSEVRTQAALALEEYVAKLVVTPSGSLSVGQAAYRRAEQALAKYRAGRGRS